MQTAGFQIFAENISLEIKKQYFRAALIKEAAWFDENNPNELSSKISSECSAIARGCGDKIGIVYGSFFQFAFGMIAAFILGWEFSLILLCFMPVMAITGMVHGKAVKTGMIERMKAYGQSAGYAEQALYAIKVVHTYGQEMLELRNYSKHLETSLAKGR